jgi:hypothetical protein
MARPPPCRLSFRNPPDTQVQIFRCCEDEKRNGRNPRRVAAPCFAAPCLAYSGISLALSPDKGYASPTGSAGHASATANLKLTFHPDHSAGADQPRRAVRSQKLSGSHSESECEFRKIIGDRGQVA